MNKEARGYDPSMSGLLEDANKKTGCRSVLKQNHFFIEKCLLDKKNGLQNGHLFR